MSQPFPGLVRTVRALDGFAERCGAAVAWLMVPMLAAVAWEVVARYAFDAPTSWAYETLYNRLPVGAMAGAHARGNRGVLVHSVLLFSISSRVKIS